MSGWSRCRSCGNRIWWGSAPFDSSRNWPYDDEEQQVQHFDTCAAVERVINPMTGAKHRVSKCRACGARVWWDTTPRGKRRPMNTLEDDPIGVNECHFDTCPGEPIGTERPAEPALVGAAPDIELWLGQLGLSYPASLEQITAAFRKLAMRHHPDMGGNASDFIRIKLAFDRCKELLAAGVA